jgi:hypothetical protein
VVAELDRQRPGERDVGLDRLGHAIRPALGATGISTACSAVSSSSVPARNPTRRRRNSAGALISLVPRGMAAPRRFAGGGPAGCSEDHGRSSQRPGRIAFSSVQALAAAPVRTNARAWLARRSPAWPGRTSEWPRIPE